MTETGADECRMRRIAHGLIAGRDKERRRIARDLHDGMCQELAVIAFEMRSLVRFPELGQEVESRLRGLIATLDQLTVRVRALSHDLHPARFELLGLSSALHSLCVELERRSGLRVTAVIQRAVEHELPSSHAWELYSIAQEALNNVARHAQVEDARLELRRTSDEIRMAVIDRGVGFDPSAVDLTLGLGLVSIEERTTALGGVVRILAKPGQGTELRISIPLTGAEVAATLPSADPVDGIADA